MKLLISLFFMTTFAHASNPGQLVDLSKPFVFKSNVLEINHTNLVDYSTEEDDSLNRKNCNLTITYRDTNMKFRNLKIEKAHGEDIDSLNDGLNGIHAFKNVQTYNNHCTERVLLIDLKRSTVKFREYLTSCPHFN
ncbi:MAG: hypothetical protein PHY93_18180 [Bacteriovorax sp.]|nr:hypothetical protein [Bacteriovorax sp.]